MNVEKIREMYPEGTQIILQEMQGENQMPYGLKGTVKFVDDAGQIHMRWENGSSLALNIDGFPDYPFSLLRHLSTGG